MLQEYRIVINAKLVSFKMKLKERKSIHIINRALRYDKGTSVVQVFYCIDNQRRCLAEE